MPRAGWLLLMLTGCFYATRADFDEAWDRDGDGWPLGEDCAPFDANIYPGAPDSRGDGCDADCSTESDRDNDDWPDDSDCEPDDPNVFPCAEDVANDGVDSDCDGLDTPRVDVCPIGEGPILGEDCGNPSL